MPYIIAAIVFILSVPLETSALAQIPDTFTNLRELPEDISKRDLLQTMKAFSLALGVRCQHCHVGGDGRTLAGVDFASDADPDKVMARFMMRMTRSLNRYALPQAPGRRPSPVAVTCKTCHRGRAVPTDLRTELQAAYDADGIEGVRARYRDLRAADYGRGRFDFGEDEVSDLAEALVAVGKGEDAIEVIRLNVEHYPRSARAQFTLGLIFERLGQLTKARSAYEAALTNQAGHPGARARLDRLPAGETGPSR